jgi:hypothetical protein
MLSSALSVFTLLGPRGRAGSVKSTRSALSVPRVQ